MSETGRVEHIILNGEKISFQDLGKREFKIGDHIEGLIRNDFIKNLKVNIDDDILMYHGTVDDRIEKIKNEGIKASQNHNYGISKYAIYLTSDKQYAKFWAEDSATSLRCAIFSVKGKYIKNYNKYPDLEDLGERGEIKSIVLIGCTCIPFGESHLECEWIKKP